MGFETLRPFKKKSLRSLGIGVAMDFGLVRQKTTMTTTTTTTTKVSNY